MLQRLVVEAKHTPSGVQQWDLFHLDPKSVEFMMLSNLFSLNDLPRVTILLLRRVPLSRLGLTDLSSVPVTHLNLPLFTGTRKAVFLPLEAG